MKTHRLHSLLLIGALISGSLAGMAQSQIEYEVPGDNFSLEGALELFKQSSSPEEFEKMLNTPGSKVNNLDLNNDRYIDYIRVIARSRGNVHIFVLQAVLSERDSQDVAVIELEKLANGKAVLQITGDADIYGIETIIVPTEEVLTYAGTTVEQNVVDVWTWPSVQYVYSPSYVVWVSPWLWAYQPVWWRPWSPVSFHMYYSWWQPYRPHYISCHTHRTYYTDLYRPHRTTSVIVVNNYGHQIKNYRRHNHYYSADRGHRRDRDRHDRGNNNSNDGYSNHDNGNYGNDNGNSDYGNHGNNNNGNHGNNGNNNNGNNGNHGNNNGNNGSNNQVTQKDWNTPSKKFTSTSGPSYKTSDRTEPVKNFTDRTHQNMKDRETRSSQSSGQIPSRSSNVDQKPVFQSRPSNESREQKPAFQSRPSNESREQKPAFQPRPSNESREQKPAYQSRPSNESREQKPAYQPRPSNESREQKPAYQPRPSNESREQKPAYQSRPSNESRSHGNSSQERVQKSTNSHSSSGTSSHGNSGGSKVSKPSGNSGGSSRKSK